MKLIKSSWEILEQAPGLEGIYEAIERAGRVCYKSSRPEGKTAKDFVDMLIKRGHLSPLEHGTVYLQLPETTKETAIEHRDFMYKYFINPYSKVYNDGIFTRKPCITTNYRVLYENDWLDDLKYLCEPTEHHEKRVGVKVNCSIGISREWNRHRSLSICEQSTRYCNYSKDKFGNELTFVIPSWLVDLEPRNYYEDPLTADSKGIFLGSMLKAEYHYKILINNNKLSPQQAREVLPLATATEVIYTGYPSDWMHFFDMRCDKAAHPDMRAIAIPLKEEFINRNYIK